MHTFDTGQNSKEEKRAQSHFLNYEKRFGQAPVTSWRQSRKEKFLYLWGAEDKNLSSEHSDINDWFHFYITGEHYTA